MSAPLAFCDVETTGLHPDRHEIWEVGLIVDGDEHRWLLPVDLETADPIALNIGRFHERHPHGNAYMLAEGLEETTDHHEFARQFARLTHGCHLVGAVISFDEERLRRLLLGCDVQPSWHYHLVDVEALAAGKLGVEPPWDTNELCAGVGVDPDKYEKHTALGDARWARAIWNAVMGES